MLKNSSDDEIQILDILHPKLLIERNKPMKIHLDGFMPLELLALRDIVKKNGGQISREPGIGIITLSPSNYFPMIRGERFNIDWLHKSISLNAVQNILKYELTSPLEMTIKDDPDAQDKNELPILDNIEREPEIYQISSPPTKWIIATKSAARPEIKSNTQAICSKRSSDVKVPECERRVNKSREASSVKRICICGASHTKKRPVSARRTSYPPEEERAMVNFLIENDAIHRAGGYLIWKEMVREKKSKRKATVLQNYFNTRLRYRVDLYTHDKRALAEFKERETKLQKRRNQYRN